MFSASALKHFVQQRGLFIGVMLLLLLAPPFLSDFRLNLLGKFLTFALLALGLDLIWGYGGMLSLGQGLFFALGAYTTAMYLKLEASGSHLPDFMSWSGLESLPFFWQPFHSPIFALAAAILLPTCLAALIGYLVFRSRTRGVYFSIITQALTLIMSILFIGQQPYTGGTNGITDLSTVFGFSRTAQTTQTVIYLITVVCLGGAFLLCRWLTQSRFGRLLVAMRDDEDRVRFLGYDPVLLKTLVFALSAALAGLAGALFIPQVGIISPSAMGVVPSIEIVVWVAVGGRGTLAGAILGALLVSWGKSAFSETFPTIWQYFMGAMFISTVLLFPKGVLGYLSVGAARLKAWLAQRRGPAPAQPDAVSLARHEVS